MELITQRIIDRCKVAGACSSVQSLKVGDRIDLLSSEMTSFASSALPANEIDAIAVSLGFGEVDGIDPWFLGYGDGYGDGYGYGYGSGDW